MKIAHFLGGRHEPGLAAGVVADSLMAAGVAVATVLILSADGGSLSSVIAYLQDHLFVLIGG